MPQQSLSDWVEILDKAGLLVRYSEETRVDQIPSLMEQNPDSALLVEKIADCAFPLLANAYGVREQYALALGCKVNELGPEIAKRSAVQIPPRTVETASCKEVVIRGEDVDLTIFPLFLHHPLDGHAYLNDTNVISRNPETGLTDQGIYRFMFRTTNELNIDMRNPSHIARVNTILYQKQGKDMPIAIVIGGPTLDKIASMFSFHGIDDWDILGGFYGEAARVVKCETNDLTVPANAEIVLEGRVISTEGWTHDEGPYGEYTGTYGGGLPHNNRVVIDAITHRKGAIYQHATIGGMHPGRTDMMAGQPGLEGDLYMSLRRAGLNVLDVHLPPGGCSNIAYARLKTLGGGDAQQALAVMLTSSRQWHPKIAYVFDEDVDIFDDERVKWAMAWRLNPETGILRLPRQNVLPLDPTLGTDRPPVFITKIGFDCTIPVVGEVDRPAWLAATVMEPLTVPGRVEKLSEADIAREMEQLISEAPRSWKELVEHFAGQPYPALYKAFSSLRHRLGRVADDRPNYPYTFAETDFVTSGAK